MEDERDGGMVLRAWGDESVRMAAETPMYLLAASVPGGNWPEVRDRLVSLMPRSASKLHWRDMGKSAQRKSLEAIAGLEHSTTIVVAAPLAGNKQERARRKCLQSLLVALENDGVALLTLESRGEALDRKDTDFLFWLRRRGEISSIDLAHAPGDSDPRLFLPDQVLGAYSEIRSGSKGAKRLEGQWGAIEPSIRVIDVRP